MKFRFKIIIITIGIGIISGCSDKFRSDSVRYASIALSNNNCKKALSWVNTANKYGEPSSYEKKELEEIKYKCSSRYEIDLKNKEAEARRKKKEKIAAEKEKAELTIKREIAQAKAKAGPPPRNYIKSIKLHMYENLLDSRSVIDFSVTKPVYNKCLIGSYYNYVYGWLVVAKYNTKNQFGAYYGLTQHEYFFQGEKIEVIDTGSYWNCLPLPH